MFYRIKGFDISEWENMRRSGRVLLGRFLHGRVRYVLSKDAPAYVAAYRNISIKGVDQEIMEEIRQRGDGISMRQIVSRLKMPKDQVKDSIDRLDKSMYIVRRYEEREEWSSENLYIPYDSPEYSGEAMTEIVSRFIRAYGPVSLYSIMSYTQFPIAEISAVLKSLVLTTISVGEAREEMYLFKDELTGLKDAQKSNSPRGSFLS